MSETRKDETVTIRAEEWTRLVALEANCICRATPPAAETQERRLFSDAHLRAMSELEFTHEVGVGMPAGAVPVAPAAETGSFTEDEIDRALSGYFHSGTCALSGPLDPDHDPDCDCNADELERRVRLALTAPAPREVSEAMVEADITGPLSYVETHKDNDTVTIGITVPSSAITRLLTIGDEWAMVWRKPWNANKQEGR
jgi:hypothetical protein